MIGDEIYQFAKELWPLNRSITGNGLRETLQKVSKHLSKFEIKSVPSDTKVFDWSVPKEWDVKEAYIITPSGMKICDFSENNLHLVGYSIPFEGEISFEELKTHLHTLPDQPNAIPYVTSYYEERWGFCLSHEKFNTLERGIYKVVIKSRLFKGELNYGELLIKGKSEKEIFLSTYICHPSMANNELSGSIVSLSLISYFKNFFLDKTIRFIFIPETIGSIAYIKNNFINLKKNTIGGYNLSCIGDERNHSCILSKYEDTVIDKSLIEAYKKLKIKFKKFSFLFRGSDERQFNFPGVDLPVATICRSKFLEYPEYHTSLDNFDLVTKKGVYGGFRVVKEAVKILQKKIIPKSLTICEPKLSKKGLHKDLSIKSQYSYKSKTKNLLSFLQYSDGSNDIDDIKNFLNIDKKEALSLYSICKKNKLVE